MLNGKHRSFRLTPEPPEPYMDGMRVKPRLRCVHLAVCTVRLSLIVGCIALFWAIVLRVPNIQPRARPFGFVGAVGHLFIARLMNYVGILLGLGLATRVGLLSDSEASAFHHRMDRWPECWLEPRPGHKQRHPLDAIEGEPCQAPEHSVRRILKSRFSVRAW